MQKPKITDGSNALFSHRPYWAKRFPISPFFPTTRQEMDDLGWDSCDIILVTGDAYIDHPSFGMALIGRLLEAQGFRVGILPQPAWSSVDSFQVLGPPNLFWGVTGGNMDSLVNRYTSDRRIRSDDAYSPGGIAGLRPDRAVLVYSQLCRSAYPGIPIVIGGIEASLRRVAHYDYWSDTVRRSLLIDSGADLLVYGNAERAIVDIAHHLGERKDLSALHHLRGTAFVRPHRTEPHEIDSTRLDMPGRVEDNPNPYAEPNKLCGTKKGAYEPSQPEDAIVTLSSEVVPLFPRKTERQNQIIRLPSYETAKQDKVLYAHASRILHREANAGNGRALVQQHGKLDVVVNPPPLPLTTKEMDSLYGLPFARVPHPRYGDAKIPAYEMIKFSVNILRGCFGGCTFCSITEHEGRIIQSRSEASILHEIEQIRDRTPGFTGNISDLGGPTANMYRMACKSRALEAVCRRPSCIYPGICEHMQTDHTPLIRLYRKARAIPGVKRIFIASGVRYDLAVRSPEWIKELAEHHTGGYLKIAPEHTESGPLSHMMKPGISAFYQFKQMFERFSSAAGKEQYLIPYFIAAHPGTKTEDMLKLALWLKNNGFRPDQVQAFLPSPMATATAMYYTEVNPLSPLRDPHEVHVEKSLEQRRIHKAFLRYHDPNNWPLLRKVLREMGREDLIGNGKQHLIPSFQPQATGFAAKGQRKSTPNRESQHKKGVRKGAAWTQHTGLPALPIMPKG
jgi:uncharacterized radical SAM protein YgiQ